MPSSAHFLEAKNDDKEGRKEGRNEGKTGRQNAMPVRNRSLDRAFVHFYHPPRRRRRRRLSSVRYFFFAAALPLIFADCQRLRSRRSGLERTTDLKQLSRTRERRRRR